MTDHHVPTAREIMAATVITTRRDVRIFDAIGQLLKHKISGMPVVDEAGRMIGMLSELDCLRVLAGGEFYDDDHSEEGTVADYMTAVGQSVGPDVDAYGLAQYFLSHSVRRLPVVEDEQLLGQVSRRDVLRAIEKMGADRIPRKHYPDYREPSK